MSDAAILETRKLEVRAGTHVLLRDVNLRVERGQVFGIIGPSGAGKSTLLRCLNRLNDLVPGLRVSGEVLLRGQSIYVLDVNTLRARIGMLFQQPRRVSARMSFSGRSACAASRVRSRRRSSSLRCAKPRCGTK